MTEETEEVSKYPYWISKYGNGLGKKTYGRIWVRTEEDRVRVVKIIEELDPDEASYMGSRDGGKDDFCRDKLRYECWVHASKCGS